MMRVKIRHLVVRSSGCYFQPSASMRAAGYRAEPLGRDEGAAIERVNQINREWDRDRKGEALKSVRPGSVGDIIVKYQASDAYKALKPKTKKEYDAAIGRIEGEFGRYLVNAVKRSHLIDWLEEETKRISLDHARRLYKLLRILFRRAKDADLRKDNPAADLQMRMTAPRKTIWTEEQVVKFEDAADKRGRPSLALLARICFDLCQRPGDARLLPPSAWNGKTVRVTQSKTAALVEAPATLALRKRLLAAPKGGKALVINETTGEPYNEFTLGDEVRLTCERADLPGELQARDWRRSGMVRLAQKGATTPQIAAVSGHQIERVQKILEVYIPRDSVMAAGAIATLKQASKKRGKANKRRAKV